MRLPRHELSPVAVYYLLSGGYIFIIQVIVAVNLLFQTQEAELTALQLVTVGALYEAGGLICEVPTGALADIFGRRLSVVLGFLIMGAGVMFLGAFARFETIAAGALVWGVGYAFLSGARQAWLADEIGVEAAGPVYLRASQIQQICRLGGIPAGALIGSLELRLPLLVAGGLFIGLALLLVLIMPERGFRREYANAGFRPAQMLQPVREGAMLVRASPLLLCIFGIALFLGAKSEGFDRLWVAHFDRDTGFPSFGDLTPVVWIAIMREIAAVGGIGLVQFARRRIDTSDHAAVSRGLFLADALQMLAVMVFALAGAFALAMAAYCVVLILSSVYEPLQVAWINQNVGPRVRATVLSLNRQTDSFGQIIGGPLLGVVGTVLNLRAALFAAGLCAVPALLLYMRAFGLHGRRELEVKTSDAEPPRAGSREGLLLGPGDKLDIS